jgi:hypothetical protein
MQEVALSRNVNSNSDAAAARLEAIAQARRAALEAAAARRAEAAAQAAEARKQAAKPGAVPVPADANTEAVRAARGAQVGPKGAVPLPPPPGDADSLLAAMAEFAPPELVAQAAAYMSALRGELEGPAAMAAGAITGTMMDPSGFYEAAGRLKGSDQMATSEADVRAVASMTTADNLAAKLREEPDLTQHSPETVKQLASFREVAHPELQSAIDNALETTFKGDLEPDQITREMAYMAHHSQDSGVKDALEGKMKDWADSALEKSMDGKEKDSGVEKGLSEFQEEMVALAERTGMGDVVQKASEDALKDGEKLIEETAKRGRSLWDKFTGAVSGFIDGAFGAIGDGIKKAIGAVGDVAEFAVDKVGDVAEAGLDVAAAGLDAVGLDGAADFTRAAGDHVDAAYDWVGKQANGFVDGVGDALGDTVIGVGSVIAHPVDTVKAVGHLVTHPQEIVTVGKALWAEASKGGIAHALGYVAGNIAPALLTGGSTNAATLGGRLAAVAGESRVLTTLVNGAKASRVGMALSRGGQAASTVSRAIGQSRVGQLVGRGAELAGKARTGAATFVRESSLGKLAIKAGEQTKIPQLVDRFKAARTAFNTKVDDVLGAQVRKLDDTALGKGVERALPKHVPQSVTTEARLAELAAQAPQGPIRLEDGIDVEGVIKQRGADGDAIYQQVDAADAQRLDPKLQREIGEIPRQRGLRGADGEIQNLRAGDRLQGTFSIGKGQQPDIVAAFGGPGFEAKIGRRIDAIDPNLPATEKIRQINEIVNDAIRPNFDPKAIDELDAFHQGFNDRGMPVTTEDYLTYGMADCRGYAVVNQMALQRAGLQSGIATSKTVLQDLAGPVPAGLVREADGLSHFYNVVQVDGKQIIADAFNPAASGNELAEALARGFVDRGGDRIVHYLPGAKGRGAVILNDGAGGVFDASALVAPVGTTAAAQRE